MDGSRPSPIGANLRRKLPLRPRSCAGEGGAKRRMSNHESFSLRARHSLVGFPGGSTLKHSVNHDNELSHTGDDGKVVLLSAFDETEIEGFELRVVMHGSREGRHIEGIAGSGAAALNEALAFMIAAA